MVAISQSLRLLEARGWISKEADPADRRVVRLRLTEAGRARLDEEESAQWQEAFAGLSAAGRETMNRNDREIGRSIGAAEPKHSPRLAPGGLIQI